MIQATLTTTLPVARFDMMRSYALRTSSNSKTESTMGFTDPGLELIKLVKRGNKPAMPTVSDKFLEGLEVLEIIFYGNHPLTA